MKKRILFILPLLLFSVFTPVYGDDYQDGLDAYNQKDYKAAYEKWGPLAEQGNAHAQSNIGLMFDNGQGVTQDFKEASKWYRLAAEKGQADAQTNLGVMYGKGHGVIQDYKEAVKWYRLAAEQGHVIAQSNLGLMYARGHGVTQDYVQAHKWFNIAGLKGKENDFRDREIAEMRMTLDQIAEAQRLASEWMEKYGN